MFSYSVRLRAYFFRAYLENSSEFLSKPLAFQVGGKRLPESEQLERIVFVWPGVRSPVWYCGV